MDILFLALGHYSPEGIKILICQFIGRGNLAKVTTTAAPLLIQRYITVSNRSSGMISSRFPGDIFTKIQQNLQFYRHLSGRVTNPWDHTDRMFTQAIAQLKDIYRGLIAPISINPGLLQGVLLVHC